VWCWLMPSARVASCKSGCRCKWPDPAAAAGITNVSGATSTNVVETTTNVVSFCL
jgi:hypothetical protein